MRGLIAELRHRNVIRVGVAYIVVGWLIAQVADLAADAFSAPVWVMQMLIIMLLLGLPVALFLAWAFELTPEGVVKAEDLPSNALGEQGSNRISRAKNRFDPLNAPLTGQFSVAHNRYTKFDFEDRSYVHISNVSRHYFILKNVLYLHFK